jgi:hypothetical protein
MQAATAKLLGLQSAPHPLRDAFLRWQCRVRQMMMRDDMGRPGDAITPALTPAGETEPMGHIITVLSKTAEHSKTPEMQHMANRTQDPASRRESALKFFSEFYYQKGAEFSDTLTATFPAGSEGAAKIRAAERVTLSFDAFRQTYDLECRVWQLAEHNPLWQATYWHNHLFNPALTMDTVILAFEPDWDATSADPSPV